MSASHDVYFREDARWNDERECVEVTVVVREGAEEYPLACAISREALESQLRTTVSLNPLRLFRDYESQMEAIVARKAVGRPPEIAVTLRDVKR